MVYEQFMEDIQAGKVQLPKASMFNSIWAKIVKYQNEANVYLENGFTREVLMDMFMSMGLRNKDTFLNYKTVTMKYVRYLVENGHISADHIKTLNDFSFDDIPVSSTKIQYYRNIAALKEAIDDSLKTYGENNAGKDVTILYLPVTALYLSWFGFTEQEIVDVKKSDVCDTGVMKNGTLISMPKSIMETIIAYKKSGGFERVGRSVYFCYYKDSEYLIRSSDFAHLDVELLRAAIYRLNKVCNKKYSLSTGVVFTSGLFFRIFTDEMSGIISINDSMTPEECGEYLGEEMDKTKFRSFLKNYNLYKKHFQLN